MFYFCKTINTQHTLKANVGSGIVPILTIKGSIPTIEGQSVVRLVETRSQGTNSSNLVLRFEKDIYDTCGNDPLLIEPFVKVVSDEIESILIHADNGDIFLKVERSD